MDGPLVDDHAGAVTQQVEPGAAIKFVAADGPALECRAPLRADAKVAQAALNCVNGPELQIGPEVRPDGLDFGRIGDEGPAVAGRRVVAKRRACRTANTGSIGFRQVQDAFGDKRHDQFAGYRGDTG